MNSTFPDSQMSNFNNNPEKSFVQKMKERFLPNVVQPKPPKLAKPDTQETQPLPHDDCDTRKIRDAIMALAEGMDIVARNNRLFVENNLSKNELVKLRNDYDILSRKHKELENKLDDSKTELLGANCAATECSRKVEKIEAENATHVETIRQLKEEAALALATIEQADSNTVKLQDDKVALNDEVAKVSGERDAAAAELEVVKSNASLLEKRLKEIIGLQSVRLSYYVPASILQSNVGDQVLAFDEAVTCGDLPSMRVMAGLSQLNAALIPGSGSEDRLVAVNAIGTALYAVWSTQSKDAKTIHALFTQWQEFLNGIPAAGYQIVVPDLGQSVPQSVTAPPGVTKVSEVQLWIVKGQTGGLYSKGIVT